MNERPYVRPELYDLEYADYDEDYAFYLGLAAGKSPVLELGCGSGRLAIQFARNGSDVHGVDLEPAMLEALMARRQAELPAVAERITTEQGDFTAYQPRTRYELVLLPFNAIHHCVDLDAVRAVFATARRAVTDTGLFALDLYLFDASLYDRDPGGRYEVRTFVHPLTGGDLVSWEQGWWDAEKKVHHVVYVYHHQDDDREEKVHLELHMYELDVLEQLMEEAGFEIVSAARDFVGTPLGRSPLKWVGVLRPKGT
jgi:SAM-dependent methyltransferase